MILLSISCIGLLIVTDATAMLVLQKTERPVAMNISKSRLYVVLSQDEVKKELGKTENLLRQNDRELWDTELKIRFCDSNTEDILTLPLWKKLLFFPIIFPYLRKEVKVRESLCFRLNGSRSGDHSNFLSNSLRYEKHLLEKYKAFLEEHLELVNKISDNQALKE